MAKRAALQADLAMVDAGVVKARSHDRQRVRGVGRGDRLEADFGPEVAGQLHHVVPTAQGAGRGFVPEFESHRRVMVGGGAV